MLEMLINPRKAERHPWELFFVGAFYASISLLLVNWIFSQDAVLSKYAGVLVVTFTVMFSMPFIYYTIKLEEKKITREKSAFSLLKEHERAIYAFMWLFIGFIVAFSFWYTVLSSTQSFRAQIETYCLINRPTNYNECVKQYGIQGESGPSAFLTNKERLFLIFTNNMYVLLFTLLFSLLFGAGVIFVLAWNATVISAAVVIFTKSTIAGLPMGILRYMIHGVPEIASYFTVALAGGMVSVAVIKHEAGTDKFWEILQDSLNLIIVSVIILFIAALIEVFITPAFF
ncbi:stage II sporulation protein M [Candidatus Pacearchaeota archaeon]|nr:stage II sporulation protein M [Candidatus Pacearchaeota archaeon]